MPFCKGCRFYHVGLAIGGYSLIQNVQHHGHQRFCYFNNDANKTLQCGSNPKRNKHSKTVPWEVTLERLLSNPSCVPFSAYVSLLRSCCNSRSLRHGRNIHSLFIKLSLEHDHFLGNLLLLFYCKCGAFEEAYCMFQNAKYDRNIFSWAILIGGCADHGYMELALQLFNQMPVEGIMPDNATFVNMLSVCRKIKLLKQGTRAHILIIESGLESNVTLETALVNMYGSCGNLDMARHVFNSIKDRNVITWTAMITIYSDYGNGKGALALFYEMQISGVIPNEVTYISLLKSCAIEFAFTEGTLIHTTLTERNLDTQVIMGNALVHMYSECSSVDDGWAVFSTMTNHDVVSWTTTVSAFAKHGYFKDVFWLFDQMQIEGLIPDRVTFLGILSVCVSQNSLLEGKKVHLQILSSRQAIDVVLGTALINMYGKCGKFEDAQGIFNGMEERNLVAWNAMIMSYTHQGEARKAIQLFERMLSDCIDPDAFTFSSILSACSHAGLVEEGYRYAHKMYSEFGIQPAIEHYNCLVGLLGRQGLIKRGESLMDIIPVQPSAESWVSLLASCKAHLDLKQGTYAATHVFELNSEQECAQIVLSNLLAAVGN